MDLNLFPDLLRQWIDSIRLRNQLHQEIPDHFRKGFQALPWRQYQYFYGVLVPVIIHNGLFRLHNMAINKNAQKVITSQAFLTGLLDDLFDHLHLPQNRIQDLIETPEYIISSEYIEEYLCQYLYKEMYECFTGNKKLLEDSVLAILKAQDWSRQQQKGALRLEKVLEITRTKGGEAVLFYRSSIDQPLLESEKEFLLDLGGLFQMTNDINDALKDHLAHENTFMTMGLPLREIREIFEAQIKQTFESWKLLANDRYHKQGFFSRINILVARSLVTLDRYGRLVNPEKPFNIRGIPRNKVISGLRIPYEIRSWYRHYTSMNITSKMPLV